MSDDGFIFPSLDPIRSFLEANSRKLFDWFGGTYDKRISLINTIGSILPAAQNFARSEAVKAQNNAVNASNAFTNSKVAGLANTVSNIASQLRGQIDNGLSALGIQIQNARNEAAQNDQNILQQALGAAGNALNQANLLANQGISNLQQTIQLQIDFLAPIKDTLIDLAIILPDEAINQLGGFLGETMDKVSDFIKCPLCPIVDWLLLHLLDLFADLLADALGSVETDLGESEDFISGLEE